MNNQQDCPEKPRVHLSQNGSKVKGEPVYDVYVGTEKTGILRRIYSSEVQVTGQEWIYLSVAADDDFNFYSYDQAVASLHETPPRVS